jgi:hypothetical protein
MDWFHVSTPNLQSSCRYPIFYMIVRTRMTDGTEQVSAAIPFRVVAYDAP